MKITVQVSIQADDNTPTVVHEVFALERGALAPDTVGLRLAEAKDLLAAVQEKTRHQRFAPAFVAFGRHLGSL